MQSDELASARCSSLNQTTLLPIAINTKGFTYGVDKKAMELSILSSVLLRLAKIIVYKLRE